MKPRVFEYGPGPHAPQLAIQAGDATLAECQLMRRIVLDNWIASPNYKLGKACGVFLQGYQEPFPNVPNSGWILVEFWTDNEAAVKAYVDHVNAEFQKYAESR